MIKVMLDTVPYSNSCVYMCVSITIDHAAHILLHFLPCSLQVRVPNGKHQRPWPTVDIDGNKSAPASLEVLSWPSCLMDTL